jgi:WD40 repeat protein
MNSPENGFDSFFPSDLEESFADWVAEIADRIKSGDVFDIDEEARSALHPEWAKRAGELLPVMEAMTPRRGRSDSPGSCLADLTPSEPARVGSLGDFQVVRTLGQGGMGIVYEAIQLSLNRSVALKILPAIQADDPRRLRRFQVEAQAAACLTHPHIVPVYLVGSEDGIPFFAMQLIDGRSLGGVIAEAQNVPISPRIAAELCRQAAEALEYAHEQRVIHRDIKPSNLLVDRSGWLWVADFGVAFVPGSDATTTTGAILGTLRYMSPEQTLGQRTVIDQRVDVYSLGATLYELLTLRPAFEGDDRIDLLRRIAQEEPRPPRRIDPTIPKDLETIVLMAMAKAPAERYETAGDLADDLGRFLQHRPIRARRPSLTQRAAHWSRRNRTTVIAAAGLLLAVVAGLGSALLWHHGVLQQHNRELARALSRAERNEGLNRRLWYGSQIRLAQQAAASGQVELAQDMLEGLRPEPGSVDLRGFEWRYLDRACRGDFSTLYRHDASAQVLAISPEGRTLLSGDYEGTLIFWDLAAGAARGRLRAHSQWISGLSFTADRRAFVSWNSSESTTGDVALWDPAAMKELARVAEIATITDIARSPDGRGLVIRDDPHGGWKKGRVRSWTFDSSFSRLRSGPPLINGSATAFTHDGRWLAVAGGGAPHLTLRRSDSGEIVRSIPYTSPSCFRLAFSPDDRILAAAHEGGITIWDVESGLNRGSMTVEMPHALKFSADGSRLAGMGVLGDDPFLLDLSCGPPRRIKLETAPDNVRAVAFSPDGKLFGACGINLAAAMWEASSGRKLAEFPCKIDPVNDMAFSPDGRTIYLACSDGRVREWHVRPETKPVDRVAGHRAEVWSLAFSPDGSTLASAGDDHTIKLWDRRVGRLIRTLKGHGALVAAIAIDPSGKRLASASFDKTVWLWDFPSGQPRTVLKGHEGHVRAVAFSPDGRNVASGGDDKTVRLWDAASGDVRRVITGHTDLVRGMAFDPQGGLLASASTDRTVRVIRLDTGQTLTVLHCPKDSSSVAFTPDGAILGVGDDLGNVTLWDVGDWSRRSLVKLCGNPVWGLGFTPDGRTVAAACGDSKVRLFDPITGQLLLELNGHAQRVNAVVFAPDGKTLASASHEGTVRLWHASSP